MQRTITIIGAGLAGLSCGIHLLNRGYRVQIFEKNERPGGRANRIEEKGYKIDMGPTLVLMPEILEGLFRSTGRNLSDYIRLRRLEPSYRINFSDGKYFDMSTDLSHLRRQIAEFAPGQEKQFDRYREDVRDKLESSRHSFIERNFNSFWDMVNPESLIGFIKIKPFGSAYDHARRYFKNDYLAAAFSCQALYLGQAPQKTPALYNLLAYLEFTYGVWYPMGGLYEIPRQLAKVFDEMGGTLSLNSGVKEIHVENGEAKGVRLEDGTLELSDAVISNRDLPASYTHFVTEAFRPSAKNEKIRKWNYGCGAMMFYLGLNKKINNLMHHNIMISKELDKPVDDIFNHGVLPREPLIYVCAPTKTDEALAPEGGEVVYILCVVPNLLGRPDWSRDIPVFRRRVLDRMRLSGVDIKEEDIELERHWSPKDFESGYGTMHGTAFGLAPDFFQSAAFRPRIKSKDIDRLYHAGASTHPGGGIPMVLTSGRLAAEEADKNFKRAVPL